MSTGKIKASRVFHEMVQSAWESGDPGLVFIDRINRDNPTPQLGPIESTNPCGEQPLLPFEACVLGSINLSTCVRGQGPGIGGQGVDWDMLADLVRLGVRFLDNAIDANKYPIPEVENMHRGNRKIGLGVMGWADLLIRLGIPYNSDKAIGLAGKIMRFIRDNARKTSAELAEKRGAFPNFQGSRYDSSVFRKKYSSGLRNATTTTIAPTGTLSIIANCSSGIEPLFALAYRRLVLETELTEVNHLFLEIARREGFYSRALMKRIESTGMLKGITEVPRRIRRLFVTAQEISPEDHIAMQAAFQKYTDNAVSKTINLSHRATRRDVAKAFVLAYEKGCKGITVFRYGSKRGTLVTADEVD